MRIPEEKIEEIRATADIVEVVGDYVSLKPRGSNFVGLCPFHNEKTASFNVNPARGIFKCFGCGKGGDVFSFIREIEKVSYPESVRMLAGRTGVELPEDKPEQSERTHHTESIYHALRFAARFFYDQLTGTEQGRARALAYFKDRGFAPATITKFGLGYAPPGWDALLRYAEQHQVKAEYLHDAGLILPRKEGDGYYDRYRDRAIFPLFSHVGRVVGFAGRILNDTAAGGGDPRQPKYINSPETAVYHKGDTLYGLFQAKQEIRRRSEVILVEGYTDVLSLFQAGIQYVVASSGTALTPNQVAALARYAQRVLLIYDADSAGAQAALRGIDLILARGLSVHVVELPEGADPDSFVRKFQGEAFQNFIQKNRRSFIDFKAALANRQGQADSPEGTLEMVRSILTSIAQIPNPILQGEYLQQASEALGIPDMELRREMAGVLYQKNAQHTRQARREAIRASHQHTDVEANDGGSGAPALGDDADPVAGVEPRPEERMLLRLMIELGAPLVEFILRHMSLEEFTEGPARKAVRAFLQMYEDGEIQPGAFLEGKFGGDVQNLAAGVLSDRFELSNNWDQRLNRRVPRLNEEPYEAALSAMTLLKMDRVDEAINSVRKQTYQAQQEGQDPRPFLEQMHVLQALRRQIQHREFFTRSDT